MIKNHKHYSPLPWTYHNQASRITNSGRHDYIEDAIGNIVVNHIGHIDGPLICDAVNRLKLLEVSNDLQKSPMDLSAELMAAYAEDLKSFRHSTPLLKKAAEEIEKLNLALAQNRLDPVIFVNDGKEPDWDHMNCPSCGGSGHVDDATTPWLPIKDAPKDGTRIDILINAIGRIPDVYWGTWDGCEPEYTGWLSYPGTPVLGPNEPPSRVTHVTRHPNLPKQDLSDVLAHALKEAGVN